MYLRAGLVSLALLLTSRVLGLLRESVQAAAFGTTALADVVVTLMTLPDLASSILAGGALSYALLPWWARQSPAGLAASQRMAARIFMALGVLLGVWIAAMPALWAHWLAPGVGQAWQGSLHAALRWSALAVPLSLLSFVWYTRLQHERDVVGMYGMNIVHTGVVIVSMLLALWLHIPVQGDVVALLGGGLLLAFGLRSGFLQWRLRRTALGAQPVQPAPVHAAGSGTVEGLPGPAVWLWAVLATGLPVALPLVARSLVSQSAPGALASFNYAWRLIELPNLLAVQLVAVLAFPAFTRAHAQGRDYTVQLRSAFCLSWTLACAGALGLALAAGPVAQILFGWGRMGGAQVAQVADWASAGAWTLLPQSLMAVVLLLLATEQRLRAAAVVYAALLGTLALAVSQFAGLSQGRAMMQTLVLLLVLGALALLVLGGARARAALAWRELAVPALFSAALAWAVPALGLGLGLQGAWQALLLGAAAALLVLAVSYAASPVLRATLKR